MNYPVLTVVLSIAFFVAGAVIGCIVAIPLTYRVAEKYIHDNFWDREKTGLYTPVTPVDPEKTFVDIPLSDDHTGRIDSPNLAIEIPIKREIRISTPL